MREVDQGNVWNSPRSSCVADGVPDVHERYRHGGRRVRSVRVSAHAGGVEDALVHGHDFLVSGRRDVVQRIKKALCQRWQIESVRAGDTKELLIFTRAVFWSESDVEHRVDPKHAKGWSKSGSAKEHER